MRLDKFLKVSRIIKRRTVANEACDYGRIQVNNKIAKASYDVKIGDIINVQFGNRQLKVKVVALNEYANKANASDLYEIISDNFLGSPLEEDN